MTVPPCTCVSGAPHGDWVSFNAFCPLHSAARRLTAAEMADEHTRAYEQVLEYYPGVTHFRVAVDQLTAHDLTAPRRVLRWDSGAQVWLRYSWLTDRDDLAERWREALGLRPWREYHADSRVDVQTLVQMLGQRALADPDLLLGGTGRTTRGVLYALVDCVLGHRRTLHVAGRQDCLGASTHALALAHSMQSSLLVRLSSTAARHRLSELHIRYGELAGPASLVYVDHAVSQRRRLSA